MILALLLILSGTSISIIGSLALIKKQRFEKTCLHIVRLSNIENANLNSFDRELESTITLSHFRRLFN